MARFRCRNHNLPIEYAHVLTKPVKNTLKRCWFNLGQLYHFIIIPVCDPGGGKTSTFENVVAPVVKVIFDQKHFHLSIETYTTAGIHRHQADSGGYGLITSDEGHRLLAAINAKQNRSEGEGALLSKMWSGKGDMATLSDQDTGFNKTSMSMCVLVQPDPKCEEAKGIPAMSTTKSFHPHI